MTPLQAFLAPNLPPLPSKFPNHRSTQSIRSPSHRVRTAARASSAPTSTPVPDAGLISSPSTTGTVCANLWPIPILGAYGWFLNVYDRALAAKVGSFVVRSGPSSQHPLTLSFSPGDKPSTERQSSDHAAFPGIVTGNINVANSVKQLAGNDSVPYAIKFFEKGGSETFWKRRNEVHVADPSPDQTNVSNAWLDPAPTYQVVSRASAYEVRQVFPGAGATPRNASKFEYFAMNLFPVWPFAKYSCFVCVWRQRDRTTPVAIDKVHGTLKLSFFDPLELPNGKIEDATTPPPTANFAVKVFFGAVTDAVVANQHKVLLAAIAASPSTRAVSETAFRIVVDNKPGVLTPNRRNELWVEVS